MRFVNMKLIKDIYSLLVLCQCLQLALGLRFVPQHMNSKKHFNRRTQSASNCICFDENVYPTLPQTIVKNNNNEATIVNLFQHKNTHKNITPYLVRLINKKGQIVVDESNNIYRLIKYKPDSFNPSLNLDVNGDVDYSFDIDTNDLMRIIQKNKRPVNPDNQHIIIINDVQTKPTTKKPNVVVIPDNNDDSGNVVDWIVINGEKVKKNQKPFQVLYLNKVIKDLNGQSVYQINVDQSNLNNIQYLNIDDWFNRNSIIRALNASPKQILQIRQSILKILQYNGLHVRQNGLVVDENGAIINLANLRIQPVTIRQQSNAAKYVQYGTSYYILPEGVSYLQALLITLADRSAILGVIPIKVSSDTNMSLNDQLKVLYNIDQNYFKRITFHEPEIYTIFSKITETRYVCDSHNKCRIISNHESNTVSKTFTPNELNGISDIIPKNGEDQLESRSALGDILSLVENPKVIYYLGILFDTIKEKKDEWLPIVDEVVKLLSDLLKPVMANKTEQPPTYRIVGGTAATSSGTPVTMKGRLSETVSL